MARANRHYIPGCVWHITHRCHKQEFLLKFEKDRKRWLYWLYQARKRYELSVLNYIVTSNHIHLLVVDTGREVISKSQQLIFLVYKNSFITPSKQLSFFNILTITSLCINTVYVVAQSRLIILGRNSSIS